ncbi:MAG: hypothetical protein KKB30_00525 [Proteobacteria bacterium]|nr:hypothetical protein [Pseudomonadota bacterium]MBU1715300.1 hypothetical protein [Pseudomonadota bacterium]
MMSPELEPDHEILTAEAKHFGIKRRQQAVAVIEDVYVAVKEWPEVFREYNVPEIDLEIIGRDISQRLEIKGSLARTKSGLDPF